MAWLSRLSGALKRWQKRRWNDSGIGMECDESIHAEVEWAAGMNSIGQQRRYVRDFEQLFAEWHDMPHAVGVNSGTSALYFALKALNVGPGDEVLTVANTWVTTISAILETGAECRFVDIDPVSGQMDPEDLARRVSARTRAVVPVHMYGIPVNMPAILDVVAGTNIDVVEDACQSIGAEIGGRPVGTWGRVACFSFHPNKLVGAAADGGMLLSRDSELVERIRSMTEVDWKTVLVSRQPRVPSRLPMLAIPFLRSRLHMLPDEIIQRRQQSQRYLKAWESLENACFLRPNADGREAQRRAVLIDHSRDRRLQRRLENCGWHSGPMYRDSLGLLEQLQERGEALPHTERLLRGQLMLPLGPMISEADQQGLIDAVLDVAAVHTASTDTVAAGAGGGLL